MGLTQFQTIVALVLSIGGVIYGVYKLRPKIKVQIKPVADNFFVGTLGDPIKHQKWTHRLLLRVFNHGFVSRTIVEGQLEVRVDAKVSYIDLLGSECNKKIDANNNIQMKFIVSDLKLPSGSKLCFVLKDSKGKTYRSDTLSLEMFDPDINKL